MPLGEPRVAHLVPDGAHLLLRPEVVGIVAEDERVAGVTLGVAVDGPDVDEEDVVLPEHHARLRPLHEVLRRVRTAPHDDVVPARAASRGPSGWSGRSPWPPPRPCPAAPASAMRWTALRVRARTSIRLSTENFSPVPSRSASIVMVVSSSVVGDGDALNRGWLRKSLGASAATTSTSVASTSGPESVRPVGVEVRRWRPARGGGPGRRTRGGGGRRPRRSTPRRGGGPARGHPVGVDPDLQGFERGRTGESAAGGDGEPVRHVSGPPGRVRRDGGCSPPLAEQRAHRDPERPREGDQCGHRRLALPRLEPGQVGNRQLGPLGHLLQCQTGPGPLVAEALGDQGKHVVQLHGPIVRPTCLRGKKICQSSRIGNTGEIVR